MEILDKSTHPVGTGWDRRTIAMPKSIVIHTTNGAKGSDYSSELRYIYDSPNIGAHYLVGKTGKVTRLLHPKYRAWHAGAVNDARFNNNNSIGIECHYTPRNGGEGVWPIAMRLALTTLVQELLAEYPHITKDQIETHRRVATPPGRKIDPSGLTDVEFYTWRDSLQYHNIVRMTRYRVVSRAVNIRTAPRSDIQNIVGTLFFGNIFESSVLKYDEAHESIRGINTWAHISQMLSGDSKNTNLGFVHTSNVTIVG